MSTCTILPALTSVQMISGAPLLQLAGLPEAQTTMMRRSPKLVPPRTPFSVNARQTNAHISLQNVNVLHV